MNLNKIECWSLWPIILVMLLLFSKTSFAYSENNDLKIELQQSLIKGTVVDVNGIPISGAAVLIKDSKIGVLTDFDGNFELENVSASMFIEISYIGFETQKIAVLDQKVFHIVLKENLESLEEVVIVGYGTQKKSDLTGSISVVDIESFEKTVSPFASQSLQGLVSGVTVVSNSGAPGEGAQIRIRGVGSISGDNAPLYIVDGVPTKNAMDYLSSNDIATINILKDAASTAIYGSRASNGVVLVTTKKGKKGVAPKIAYNSSYGFQKVGKLTEMTDTNEYAELYNEAADNDNALLPADQQILFRKKITPELLETLGNTNHLEAIFRDATFKQHHLSFSGGSEDISYSLSGSLFDQEGILLGSGYEKATGKIGLTAKINSWLTTGVNMNIYKDETQIVGSSGDGYGGNGGSAVRYAFFRTSAIPIYDENGGYVDLVPESAFFGNGYNPVGLLNYTDNVKRNHGVFGDVNFQIKFTDELFLVSTMGLDRSNSKQRRFDRTWGTNDRITNPNSLTVTNGVVSNWSISNVLNYSKTFHEKHTISSLVGIETIENSSETVWSSDRDFADQSNDLILTLGNGAGKQTVASDAYEDKLQSFFGSVNYNYEDTYFASALVRRDGSSKFKDGNRWGTFYSGSLGWRLDKDLFQDHDVISNWMLRVGYGSVGDQNVKNFGYLDIIGKGFDYSFGDVSQLGYTTTSLGNEDLQWATSNQFDLGTDIVLYKGQLEITLDYYHKTTENMLLEVSIPTSNGYATAPVVNSGKVLNTGFEFDVSYQNYVSKDFSYSISANAALIHNEVIEMATPILAGRIDNNVYATKTEVGHEIGSFYLYEMEGIFQNEVDVITHAFQGDGILPGDVKYKDLNGDGFINDLDRTHVGSPIPDVTFGFNTEFKYKNIDFSVFISGAYGQELYYQIATDIEGFYRPFNLTQRYHDERWTGEGTSNTQPRASWKAKSNNTKPSTRFLEDGSFIRVKNIQLGYSILPKITEKLKIQKLRIYTAASNIYTFTKYPGLDPEMATSDNSANEGDLAAGIDWGTYPNAITLTMGLQITF